MVSLGPEGEIGELRWRTVTIPGGLFDELHAIVIYPADPAVMAWNDGAPVIVVAPPNFTLDPTLSSAPKPVFDARYGVIEVQPVYPGWTVGGVTTSGALDDGGLNSGSALSETIRFAAGLVSLDRGTTLGHIVERPICNSRVGLLGVGTGGVTIMEALAPVAAVGVNTVGFALFEVPTLPQLITGDVGTVWMDPDPSADGDGNGIAWDDGRNIDWYEGDCDTINCALDYEDVAWDAATHPSDVFPGRYEGAPPGVLYLDRSGSGALEIAEGGGLDVDADGVVDSRDDFVLLPHYASDGGVYYNSHLTRFAEEELASWPAGVATLAESEAFWGTRTVMEEGRVVIAQYDPEFAVVVAFTEEDSLLAVADRPQAVMAHDLFAEAGWSARYNLRGAALNCLVDPSTSGGWAGGPPRGTVLEEGDTQAWAIPEVLDADAAALAGLSLLWDAFGAFDRCPGAE
ncbi:hypothetical protein LBMAG42_53950 [Deltaproteobacteria bacterium]|nr:hypothetical protein LBMAG42_53950 [Deltaproteobacteria bacterium]